jgi:hypothetical protein
MTVPSRRTFLKSAAALTLITAPTIPITRAADSPTPVPTGSDDRRYWIATLQKIATPILENLAAGTLRKNMPVESNGTGRTKYSHLEAFARLLAGIAPWLLADNLDPVERTTQLRLLQLAQQSINTATDPRSPDFLNFSDGGQALVDTAFLAQAILRATPALFTALDSPVKTQLIAALKASRKIPAPTANNWVLFAATVEAALLEIGEAPLPDRLTTELRRMLAWYKGDGLYGDGEFFHFDFYNSFVIHPMLLDTLSTLARHDAKFQPSHKTVLQRAQRYAEIQERLIAPDGSFPSVGRSTTYRFGAFQLLAQIALLQQLPKPLSPAQVRCALTAVIKKMIEAPNTFDDHGFLRVGFCGHQPNLGESYISTGSLYLCAAAFLPLGLPPTDSFWSAPATPWTSQRLWSGENLHADHALTDTMNAPIPDLP